jgi:hypothetical protein
MFYFLQNPNMGPIKQQNKRYYKALTKKEAGRGFNSPWLSLRVETIGG